MERFRTLSYLMITLVLWLASCSGSTEAYDPETALRRVLKVQELQNFKPGDPTVVPEMVEIVDSMRNSGHDAYYFGAMNVLIDRLFADGRYAEADSLAVRMQQEASEGLDSLSIAMAKRVRAQILYKLSQSDRAMEELRSALPYINRPIRSGTEFGTTTSIEEWIHIIARECKDTLLMIEAAARYAEILHENAINGICNDTTGHYPVTALAFKAENELMNNDPVRSAAILDSATQFIVKGLPARAYEHFYFTRAKLRARLGDFTGALADTDTLLSTHKNFPWFYLQDLLLKATIFDASGRHDLSADTYSDYVEYHDSISKRLTDRRLHDLTVLYRSEIDREQRRIHTIRMMALGGTTILLLILFGVTLRHAVAERKRNRLLVERLQEFDRTGSHIVSLNKTYNEDAEQEDSKILRLDRHMLNDRPYTDPALGRKELSEFIGTTQDALAQLIKSERDCSVHSYINSFRLEEARRVLDSNSDESIADIASRLGFGTARTLQRAFKERFDMTPSQYRNAAAEIRDSDNQ